MVLVFQTKRFTLTGPTITKQENPLQLEFAQFQHQ
jgi:hypothetical protein